MDMKILNFGSCNIDYVYSLDHIVEPGETESIYEMNIFPGGKGLNQSIATARAGATVYHAGCVGNDGRLLLDILQESGVNTQYTKTVDEKNGHAIIQVSSKGENSILLYSGSNGMVSKKQIDSVLKDFGIGDVLLLQNEINNINTIIEKAYKKGMCIIFNPSPFNDTLKEIDLNMISYLLLNEVEAKSFSGSEDLEANLSYFRTHYPNLKIVLTLGVRGCVYMDSDCEIHQQAFRVEAVDTTAAGDTFTGYFVAELAKGTDYEEILKLASAASALAVSKHGAAPSIPSKKEVLEVIETLSLRSSYGN